MFLPTNEAFEEFLDSMDLTMEDLFESEDFLERILFHVVEGRIEMSDIENESVIESYTLSNLTLNRADNEVYVYGGVNSAKVYIYNII